MTHRQGGFTLIELLVVIAVIGMLSTVAITSLNTARAKARDTRRKSDLEQILLAFEQYYFDHGTYILPVPDGTIAVRDGLIIREGTIRNLSPTVL
jgi:prepilin-type N-terminal cleavage/methylation domain-containing protein